MKLKYVVGQFLKCTREGYAGCTIQVKVLDPTPDEFPQPYRVRIVAVPHNLSWDRIGDEFWVMESELEETGVEQKDVSTVPV